MFAQWRGPYSWMQAVAFCIEHDRTRPVFVSCHSRMFPVQIWMLVETQANVLPSAWRHVPDVVSTTIDPCQLTRPDDRRQPFLWYLEAMTLPRQLIENLNHQTRRHSFIVSKIVSTSITILITRAQYLLVLKYLLRSFHMEFMLVDNFLKVFDPFVQHMIVSCQMCINHTHWYTIQIEANANGTFITLWTWHYPYMRTFAYEIPATPFITNSCRHHNISHTQIPPRPVRVYSDSTSRTCNKWSRFANTFNSRPCICSDLMPT